jgi:hypothetical protein
VSAAPLARSAQATPQKTVVSSTRTPRIVLTHDTVELATLVSW